MPLKSDLIAAAQIALTSAREQAASAIAGVEDSSRALVEAELSPDDWTVSVPQDASTQTTAINGVGCTGTDIVNVLNGLGYTAEAYTPYGNTCAVVKGRTEPTALNILVQTMDGEGNWSSQDTTATFIKLE